MYQGQAKGRRGEWVKQCEILVRDPTQRPRAPSHQRPTVSLQANIKLANYTQTVLEVHYMPSCDLQGITYSGPSVAEAALDRVASGGTPHENTTYSPNDESVELELGDWTEPSIAEVLNQGGGCI